MSLSRRSLCAPAVVALLAVGPSLSCSDPTVTVPDNGDGGGSPAINGLQQIDISPADLVLTGGDQVQTQAFVATGLFQDGHREDITTRVAWSAVPGSLGRIDAKGAFTTGGFGGEGTIFARSGGVFGSTRLRVRVTRVVVEADVPAGTSGGSFGGAADTQTPPRLVYPYDQVLMPPNLAQLEVHFQRGGAAATPNTLFEITLKNQVTDLTVYTGCRPPAANDRTGCVYGLSPALASAMAYSNLDNERDPVVIKVRGTNDSKKVGASATAGVKFAPEDLRGGVYYWTAEGGESGVYRLDLVKQLVEPFYTINDAPADHRGQKTCVGCHALSHAGDRTTLVLGGGHISDLLMLNVERPKPALFARIDTTAGKTQAERQFSNYQTFSADGSTIVSALRGTLSLFSATDGSPLIGSLNTGGKATQPDWSRSGALLAFMRYSDVTPVPPANEGDNAEFYVSKGSIGLLRWDGRTFTDLRTLVAEKAGQNSYYPTVAPGDQFVVYNRASGCATAADCQAYHNPRAKLYMIATQNGIEQELGNINRGGPNDVDSAGKARDRLTNSWPKFSPFRQTTSGGRTILWVTFSSTRNYGVRLVQDPAVAEPRPQLWMAAITVGGEPVGGDLSSPPFWIPYQNLKTNNHIAQWTEQVVPILQ